MSPAVATLHHYMTTVASLGPADMQATAYIVGGAFLLFAASAIWRSLTSRY